MKIWRRYSDYLMTGEWHIHTSYTDGNNTIEDYCRKATELGIPLLAFTEHVRRNLNYDYSLLLNDIDLARSNYPNLVILSGCEAKVLPDGSLDVNDDIMSVVDYPIFAYHSFQKDKKLVIDTLLNVINTYPVNTWAHPGHFLIENSLPLSNEELEIIYAEMIKNDVLLEFNRKYNLPPTYWKITAHRYSVNTVRGSDLHSINNMF